MSNYLFGCLLFGTYIKSKWVSQCDDEVIKPSEGKSVNP